VASVNERGSFWKNFKSEFKQIVWPKKEQIIKKTLVVILVSVILTALILCYDAIFTSAYAFISKKFM
jgi:preprotein translocase subunit SecE